MLCRLFRSVISKSHTAENSIPAPRVTFFSRTSIFMPIMKFPKVGIFTNTAGRNCKVFSINRFRFAVIVITQCIRNRFPGKSPSEKRRSGCKGGGLSADKAIRYDISALQSIGGGIFDRVIFFSFAIRQKKFPQKFPFLPHFLHHVNNL